MTAAQMLAAAGEPNTKAGRAKFHKRFPTKQAFDAWYNSKKEYGGGLTDGIAFPQQPMASYAYGGASAKQFFAPNYMPFNGPIGFYEDGGMTDEIAFPQQPTERINFSAFPWQPKYTMGGLPGGANNMPCLECGGYMQPGGSVGYQSAPDPDVFLAAQDRNTFDPATGQGAPNVDYSKVTNPNTPLLNNYTVEELNNMGANIPVPNPVQDGRFAKIAAYNKTHPYVPGGDGFYRSTDPSNRQKYQYISGKYTPYFEPKVAATQVNGNVPFNKYGGYMQMGGTTQMDQGQYTNNMTNAFMNSINNNLAAINNFNALTNPDQLNEAEEAGYAAYGYEMGNNQMSDFNTIDRDVINNMSANEDRLNQLRNEASNALTGFGSSMANMMNSRYDKPANKVVKGKSGNMPATQQSAPVSGTSNNWASTRSNMAAEQAASNMFKEYGGNFFQTGGTESSPINFEKRVQDILMKGQPRPTFGQSSAQSYKGNAAQAAANTQGSSVQQTQQQYTPEQIAAFQSMMQNYFNQNQGNYAPSWQAQQNQNNAYDAWKALSRDPEALKKFLSNSGIQDMKWNNKMGMFGPKSKGHITFRTYYDPKTGKTVTAPADKAAASGQPDAVQAMQKGPKGPGFIKNLIAKNKQRKAGKQATKEQQLKEQQIANSRIAQATPGTTDPVNYFGQNFENNNRLSPGMQAELSRGQKMPLTGDERKKQFFDNRLDQDTDRPSPAPQGSIPYYPGSEPIGFAYGGFPQYNYGGYPQYAVGGEQEMTEEEIANYLAMGGTLEYLD